MTWTPKLTDKDTVEVIGPSGNTVTELKWADHAPGDSDANGWTWIGDYPDAVLDVVVDNDTAAALKNDIKPLRDER